MRDQVLTEKELYQQDAVYSIMDKFGEEHVYYNDNGNPAISKAVLKEFEELTHDTVVWVRPYRYWRPKEPGDGPGRMVEC